MSARDERMGQPVAEVIWLDDTNGEAALPPQPASELTIGNVAAMFEVSPWTLRYYELRGVIGRRQLVGDASVYSFADCDRIAFIVRCRRAGIGLADIAPALAAADNQASARTVRAQQIHCKSLVESLEKRVRIYDEALSDLKHLHAQLGAKLVSK